jgi:hypothetical protein
MLSPLSEREGYGTGRAARDSRPGAATGSKSLHCSDQQMENFPNTTERSQDEFGADEHLVPIQALICRVGSWLGTNQGPNRLHRVKSERTHTTHTRGDERQNKPLLR